MQAIQTTYKAPTNTRGSYVLAKCDAGKIHYPWDYAADVTENHNAACEALARKLGWTGRTFVGGGLPDGSRCYVIVPGPVPAAHPDDVVVLS